MAQNEVGELRLAGGGSSSAMPHKSNPVLAEVLVTLARFNAGLVGTLYQGLVAENERSGAAWTLEWLTLPPLVAATADVHAAVRFHPVRLICPRRWTNEAIIASSSCSQRSRRSDVEPELKERL